MSLPHSALRPYQSEAIERVVENPCHALFLDMGMGKTAIALTALKRLLDDLRITKALIVAPLKVCRTVWPVEARRWRHLSSMSFNMALGNAATRRRELIHGHAPITLLNRENLHWAVSKGLCKGYDALFIDESYGFHNPRTKRWRAAKTMGRHCLARVVMTGSPVSNSLLAIWAQMYIVDYGDALEERYGSFQSKYFRAIHKGSPGGRPLYEYEPLPGAMRKMQRRIRHQCIRLESKGHIDLPERIEMVERVPLDAGTMGVYRAARDEMVIMLAEAEFPLATAAAKVAKLLQICNGFVYEGDARTARSTGLMTPRSRRSGSCARTTRPRTCWSPPASAPTPPGCSRRSAARLWPCPATAQRSPTGTTGGSRCCCATRPRRRRGSIARGAGACWSGTASHGRWRNTSSSTPACTGRGSCTRCALSTSSPRGRLRMTYTTAWGARTRHRRTS